jgi:hypothetical protein
VINQIDHTVAWVLKFDSSMRPGSTSRVSRVTWQRRAVSMSLSSRINLGTSVRTSIGWGTDVTPAKLTGLTQKRHFMPYS